MKNKFSLWLVLMCLCLTVQAGVIENLLPKPQQIIAKGGNFRVGNVKLTTPVWQEEWKNFIAEAGGAVVDKSAREIVVKMVPHIEGAELNQEEAYRLVVSGKSIQVEAGDTLWTLADNYVVDGYLTKKEFIQEVCRLNHLSNGQIQRGEYIVIVYYATAPMQ